MSHRLKNLWTSLGSKLGVYRTIPLFFCLGAGIEWFMINVQIGKETFYDTVIRKEAEKRSRNRKPTAISNQ
uniref:Small integral membrane protein 4 n=1 Tax=Amphimedon queenslandica TaxID=400682 RepID=A0A1X7VQL8_AMPQE